MNGDEQNGKTVYVEVVPEEANPAGSRKNEGCLVLFLTDGGDRRSEVGRVSYVRRKGSWKGTRDRIFSNAYSEARAIADEAAAKINEAEVKAAETRAYWDEKRARAVEQAEERARREMDELEERHEREREEAERRATQGVTEAEAEATEAVAAAETEADAASVAAGLASPFAKDD